MAGGTHVFDMIKQLRNNENLRVKKYFKKQRFEAGMTHPIHENQFPLSEKERGALLQEIKSNEAKEIKVKLFSLLVAVLATVLLVYLFLELFHFLNK